MSASYAHRLDPRTDANLTAAIHAVGSLLGVGSIADSIVEHLKDRIGDSLSPEQRINPFSVYSGDILGRMAEYVKETFGLDKPANLYAAPQGPQAKDVPMPSDSVFALDGLGRNRFEQLTGATGGSYVRALAEVGTSSAAYGALTAPWNPASGASGLNPFNFGTSPFGDPRLGLDLGSAQALLGQGFNTTQILNSAADLKAIGLDPKNRELVEGAAAQERFDPKGRGQRQTADRSYDAWARENSGEINRRLTAIQSMQPGTPEYEAAVADLNRLANQGYVDTGQAAADERLRTVAAAPGAKPGDREAAVEAQREKRAAILDGNGVDVAAAHTLGIAIARDASTDAIVSAGGDTTPRVAEYQADQVAASDDFDVTPTGEAPQNPSVKQDGPSGSGASTAAEAPKGTSQDDQPADDPPANEPAKPLTKLPIPPAPGGIGHR